MNSVGIDRTGLHHMDERKSRCADEPVAEIVPDSPPAYPQNWHRNLRANTLADAPVGCQYEIVCPRPYGAHATRHGGRVYLGTQQDLRPSCGNT